MARITIHRTKDKRPIIPSGNGCCADVCTMLNETIPFLEKEANQCITAYRKFEVAKGREYKGETCNRLLRQAKMLRDLRLTFKERDICRCIE